MQVGELQLQALGFRLLHQGMADLQAQVIALRGLARHLKQEFAAGAADVEVERLLWCGEELS